MARKTRAFKAPFFAPSSYLHANCAHYHSAKDVADAFLSQYYLILRHFPTKMYKFYKDSSTLSYPCANSTQRSVTRVKGINAEIMASDIKNGVVKILSVQAHDSVDDSVVVGVIGLLSKDKVSKCFSQTFLLAPQFSGFYVHNDIFQFIDSSNLNIPNDAGDDNQVPVNDKGTSTEDDINQISEKSPSNSVILDEPNKIISAATEEAIKIVSYASIVAKGSSFPSSNAITVEVLPKTNKLSYVPSAVVPIKTTVPLYNEKKTTSTEASHHEVLENDQNHKSSPTKDVTDIENGRVEENSPPIAQQVEKKESYASIVKKPIAAPMFPQVVADYKSPNIAPKTTNSLSYNPTKSSEESSIDKTVYVKDIPPHVTRRTLTYAVKGFGALKHRNIQIRAYNDGYRYAFVEFNHMIAARLAVQAGFIKFDDWECPVEFKAPQIEGPEGYGGNNGNDSGNYGGCNGEGDNM